MRKEFKNILLIAGSGQNVGKTKLACQILQNEKSKKPIAVKITPHFHKTTKGLNKIQKGENWVLFEEKNNTTQKDSSLYLQNGAVKSYLILTNDSGLEPAFSALTEFLPKDKPVVIESASLFNIVKPGLFLVVFREGDQQNKQTESVVQKADLLVISNGKHFSPSTEKISFDTLWFLK